MENLKEIKVYLPQLDRHDNFLSIVVFKKKKTKGNFGYLLESPSEICNILQTMFEIEFQELQKKYEKLITQTILETFYDVDDLEKYAKNRILGLKPNR